jgi:hypothetical protein
MVPLTTLQGLAPDELRARIGARDLFIWGIGDIGLDVLTSLRRAGIVAKGFLHSAPNGMATTAHEMPVFAAADVLAGGADSFIVLASASHRRAAEAACRKAGLRPDADYLSHIAIARPVAVIEVARRRGEATTVMSARDFARVLDKVCRDQPLLCHVELAWLGDPMLNAELPEIVACCEARVPCTVTTTLDDTALLPAVLAARPSRFNVIVSGSTDSGGQRFHARIETLRSLAARQYACTRFLLRYLPRRGEGEDAIRHWQDILAGSTIALSVELPYIAPYDPLLDLCEHPGRPRPIMADIERLTWNLAPALDLCLRDIESPCLSQRVFPVIDTNLRTGLCHLYEGPELAHDYLGAPWASLLERRRETPHCRRCQAQGLHRLDIAVLSQRHPDLAKTLFNR